MQNLFYHFTFLTILGIFAGEQNLTGQTINREIGLRFSGLNDFDFIYKKETGVNKFLRFRLGFAEFDFTTTENRTAYSFKAGLALGAEKRRPIAEKLKFVHGFEALTDISFSHQKIEEITNHSVTVSPGVGVVLGFQYDVSEKFYLSVEAIPSLSVSYSFLKDPQPDGFRISGNINSNLIALSLVYQFSTEKKS